MEALILAVEVQKRYNRMPLEDMVVEFEKFTNQKVPQEAIEEFKFIGLNNVDFIYSNFLSRWGLKDLLSYERKLR
jgi:hypothetical protein